MKAGNGLVYIGLTPEIMGGFDFSTLQLKTILGSVFAGFAWAMGVPSQDVYQVGSLMGTKLVVNEFVAYDNMTSMIRAGALSQKAIVIASFALCGFANFSSIAIQIGGIGELAPSRRVDLSKLGFKALICGTLASYLSATVAGILVDGSAPYQLGFLTTYWKPIFLGLFLLYLTYSWVKKFVAQKQQNS